MAHEGLTAPAYQAIRSGSNHATEDAIRTIFNALSAEISARVKGQNKAINRFDKKVLDFAPAANTNNLGYEGVGIINHSGGASVNLTGIIAPEADGAMLYIVGTGAGTLSVLHQSASSDVGNRFVTATAGTRTITAGNCLQVVYLAGRWREVSYQ
jgi:hypothetical protein